MHYNFDRRRQRKRMTGQLRERSTIFLSAAGVGLPVLLVHEVAKLSPLPLAYKFGCGSIFTVLIEKSSLIIGNHYGDEQSIRRMTGSLFRVGLEWAKICLCSLHKIICVLVYDLWINRNRLIWLKCMGYWLIMVLYRSEIIKNAQGFPATARQKIFCSFDLRVLRTKFQSLKRTGTVPWLVKVRSVQKEIIVKYSPKLLQNLDRN